MRLFIALPLSDRLKGKINTLQEELKNLSADITKRNPSRVGTSPSPTRRGDLYSRQTIKKRKDTINSVPYAEKIRWVDPDKIHLTLAFLGEVSFDKIEKIIEVIHYAVKNEVNFECTVENGGLFPSSHRPRVLWVGITSGAEKITNIKKNLDKKLKSIGFKKEHKVFTPHLTIGRVKYIKGSSKCCEFLESEKIELGNLNVSKLQLIESILHPTGAEYRIIESVKF